MFEYLVPSGRTGKVSYSYSMYFIVRSTTPGQQRFDKFAIESLDDGIVDLTE